MLCYISTMTNARDIVDAIQECGLAVKPMQFGTMQGNTLLSYASRGYTLNPRQRQDIARLLREAATGLERVAQDIEADDTSA